MAYIYNMADTWADAGTTFTAIKMNVTDTASAAGSLLLDLQVGGVSKFSVTKSTVNSTVIQLNSNGGIADIGALGNSLTLAGNGGHNIVLPAATFQRAAVGYGFMLGTGLSTASAMLYGSVQEANHTIAQRNSTNAQTFRVYETFTDASNYSRMEVGFDAGNVAFVLRSANAGTGTLRPIALMTGGNVRWSIGATTGHFLAGVDNTYDIGATGVNRPRDLWLGRNADVRGSVYIGGFVEFLGISAGIVCLRQFATSDFNRLQFGGTTASFPSIQRNGNELRLRLADDSGFCPIRVSQVGFNGATASFPMLSNNGTILQTKLADDSAFAPHAMQYLDVTDGITAPGAAAGRARIYVDTADGDLKVVFADGTVKTIVTDT